jgi:hypothetical protein
VVKIEWDKGWTCIDNPPRPGYSYGWMNHDGFVDVSYYDELGNARIHVTLPYPDATDTKPTATVQVDEYGDESVRMSKKELRTLAHALLQAADIMDQYKEGVKEED